MKQLLIELILEKDAIGFISAILTHSEASVNTLKRPVTVSERYKHIANKSTFWKRDKRETK